jgi:hypothetical protein
MHPMSPFAPSLQRQRLAPRIVPLPFRFLFLERRQPRRAEAAAQAGLRTGFPLKSCEIKGI